MQTKIKIIEEMKKLGLSEYEVKAYLTLLEDYPVNGYSLSKNSGIPRSRIYEVLDSLKSKQIVFDEIGESGNKYYPIEPNLLFKKLENDFNSALKMVTNYTDKIYNTEPTDNKLMVIKGIENIINFVKTLIINSNKRIALSIWEDELDFIKQELDAAQDRGVIIRGIYFGKNNPYKDLVTHRRVERYLSEKKVRYMIITIDNLYTISGVVSSGDESQITWTKDQGFLNISEDYIVHDLMVNKFFEILEPHENMKIETYMDKLRKDYFDFSDEEFKKFK